VEPARPVAFRPHALEGVVIVLPVALDEVREVEKRLGKAAALDQEERDQQPAHTAVAVQEGVDRLELLVHQGALDQLREVVTVVEETLPVGEAVHHGVGRRRHIGCGRRRAPGRTDPVLRAAELPGRGLVSPPPPHQPLVQLADEA
jgi:hypothetical protein